MSYDDKQLVEVFLNWVKDGGLSSWIQHFIDTNDEAKLQEIVQVYEQIKAIFGF